MMRSSFGSETPSYQQISSSQQPQQLGHAYARHPVNTWQSAEVSGLPQMRSSSDGRDASRIAAEVMAGRTDGSLGRSLDAASMYRMAMSSGADAGGSSYGNNVKAALPPVPRFGVPSDSDTSKVLQELERVRFGIQETLAKAAATGNDYENNAPSSTASYPATGNRGSYAFPPVPSTSPAQNMSALSQQQARQQHAAAYGAVSQSAAIHAYAALATSTKEEDTTGTKYSFAEL